jgi:hypothetical protein
LQWTLMSDCSLTAFTALDVTLSIPEGLCLPLLTCLENKIVYINFLTPGSGALGCYWGLCEVLGGKDEVWYYVPFVPPKLQEKHACTLWCKATPASAFALFACFRWCSLLYVTEPLAPWNSYFQMRRARGIRIMCFISGGLSGKKTKSWKGLFSKVLLQWWGHMI